MRNNKSKVVLFANIVIGSASVLFIALIFYACYKRASLQVPLNLKLIVPLTGGLLFSIVTFFLRDSWKVNIAAFLFSLFIAAYSVELVLLVQYKTRLPQPNIDIRDKLQVLEDLRAEGVDAWPQVLSWLFVKSNGLISDSARLFPLGGISRKTIVYCNESGQWKIFESDEHGFNNPRGQYKTNNVKIALIGDSFAIGSCVKSGEDIASRLRNRGATSLNLGNGGNGPLIELAVLKEYVEPVRPEIVLWIYFEGNDLSDLKEERTSPMLMRYLEHDYEQNLLERQIEIDVALMKYVNEQWVREVRKPHMLNVIKNMPLTEQEEKKRENKFKPLKLWYLRDRLGLINKFLKPKRAVTFKAQLELFSEIIAKAYKRSSGWGGKFYFVYLPEMERYAGKNDGTFFDRDAVLDIVHKLGIPIIDFHEVLLEHPDPLSLAPFLGAHYNAEGYRLVSEFIISRLRKDGLMSGSDG